MPRRQLAEWSLRLHAPAEITPARGTHVKTGHCSLAEIPAIISLAI